MLPSIFLLAASIINEDIECVLKCKLHSLLIIENQTTTKPIEKITCTSIFDDILRYFFLLDILRNYHFLPISIQCISMEIFGIPKKHDYLSIMEMDRRSYLSHLRLMYFFLNLWNINEIISIHNNI